MPFRSALLTLLIVFISGFLNAQVDYEMPSDSLVKTYKVKRVICFKDSSEYVSQQYDAKGQLIEQKGFPYPNDGHLQFAYNEHGELVKRQKHTDKGFIDVYRKSNADGSYVVACRKVGGVDSVMETYSRDSLLLSRLVYVKGHLHSGYKNIYDSEGNLTEHLWYDNYLQTAAQEFVYEDNSIVEANRYVVISGNRRLVEQMKFSPEQSSYTSYTRMGEIIKKSTRKHYPDSFVPGARREKFKRLPNKLHNMLFPMPSFLVKELEEITYTGGFIDTYTLQYSTVKQNVLYDSTINKYNHLTVIKSIANDAATS